LLGKAVSTRNREISTGNPLELNVIQELKEYLRGYMGKHKGELFSEMPADYLQWLSATESDEDMDYTVNPHTLKKLEWEPQEPNKHLSIRQYIQRERPETKMWSVGHR
jgi:hypothetical protein